MATRGPGTCGKATLNPAGISGFSAAGGTAAFTVVLVGGARPYLPQSTVPWITVTSPTTPQEAGGPVTYSVAPNGAGQPARTGSITVCGKTFSITQVAGA